MSNQDTAFLLLTFYAAEAVKVMVSAAPGGNSPPNRMQVMVLPFSLTFPGYAVIMTTLPNLSQWREVSVYASNVS